MEPFIGQVYLLGFQFPPRGFALCQGQLLSIAQYTALFSLLGTTYGGNGTTNFGLPDLQGRVPVGQGQGRGLSNYTIGEVAGSESVTILTNNLPPHNHTVAVPTSSSNGSSQEPDGKILAATAAGSPYGAPNTADGNYGTGPIQSSIVGSGSPISVLSPFLVMNYSIALNGVFPSRN
jgi:microcystin-dependent protein